MTKFVTKQVTKILVKQLSQDQFALKIKGEKEEFGWINRIGTAQFTFQPNAETLSPGQIKFIAEEIEELTYAELLSKYDRGF